MPKATHSSSVKSTYVGRLLSSAGYDTDLPAKGRSRPMHRGLNWRCIGLGLNWRCIGRSTLHFLPSCSQRNCVREWSTWVLASTVSDGCCWESLQLAWGNGVAFVLWTARCALARLFVVISGSLGTILLSLPPLCACIFRCWIGWGIGLTFSGTQAVPQVMPNLKIDKLYWFNVIMG